MLWMGGFRCGWGTKGMSDFDFAALFAQVKTIAVVGYSDNPQRAGHFVPAYLRQQGFNIIAVNPKFGDAVDGLPCYPNLGAIPADQPVDMVDIFRAPEHLPDVLADALAMPVRPQWFWMQPGAQNEAAAQQAEAAGFSVIRNVCALAEHKRLRG